MTTYKQRYTFVEVCSCGHVSLFYRHYPDAFKVGSNIAPERHECSDSYHFRATIVWTGSWLDTPPKPDEARALAALLR